MGAQPRVAAALWGALSLPVLLENQPPSPLTHTDLGHGQGHATWRPPEQSEELLLPCLLHAMSASPVLNAASDP